MTDNTDTIRNLKNNNPDRQQATKHPITSNIVEDWGEDILNNGVKLKQVAGVQHHSRLPPHHFRISKAKVLEFYFALNDDQREDEFKKWKEMSRSEKSKWLNRRPGYHRRRQNNQRVIGPIKNIPAKTTPVTTLPVAQIPAKSNESESSSDEDDYESDNDIHQAVSLASPRELREQKAPSVNVNKSRSRLCSENARSFRQRHDHRVRKQQDKVIKEVAKLARMSYGGPECGKRHDYRILLCIENHIAPAPIGGGRPRKGSEYLEKPEVIVVGHQLKHPKDLMHWGGVIKKWAKATENEINLKTFGQDSQNDVVKTIDRFIKSRNEQRSQPKKRPRTTC